MEDLSMEYLIASQEGVMQDVIKGIECGVNVDVVDDVCIATIDHQ
jgi:hypothetical protein